MAGAQDGHQVAPRAVLAALQLAGEGVELADSALEVLIADLVVGRGHGSCWLGRVRRSSLRLHHGLRIARRTRRSRGRSRAPGGVAFVSRNFSACTYSRLDGLVTISALRSDSRNSSGPSKSAIRTRTEPSPGATCASEPAPAGMRYLAAKREASSLNDPIATRGL